MSGESALGSLWAALEELAGDSENLKKQVEGLKMPKSADNLKQLEEIAKEFNGSRAALSTELKDLKKLIEDYRDAQFTGRFPGQGPVSVTAGTPPSRIGPPEWPDPFDFQGAPEVWAFQCGAEVVGRLFSQNTLLRAHVELKWLPSKVNRRRDQDNVGHWLKSELKVLGELYKANPKDVNELLINILKNLSEFFRDQVVMRVGDWFEWAWDILWMTLTYLCKTAYKPYDAVEIAFEIREKVVPYFPEIARFWEANASTMTLFVGGVFFATQTLLARRGYKINESGDLEKNDST